MYREEIILQHYRTTHLEDWINKFYRTLKITYPEDIDISRISYSLNIFLKYKDINSHSFIQGRFRAIIIDSRLNKYKQREEFFHELCHVLLHVGRQYMMPKAFLELQEAQANRFTMYAALPFFMFRDVNFEEENLVSKLSKQFNVTEQLVQKRLEQVYNRIYSNRHFVRRYQHGTRSHLFEKV